LLLLCTVAILKSFVMHTNYNLVFDHKLVFSVFHDTSPVHVTIRFADKQIFANTYTPGIEHTETVRFEHLVPDGDRNIIEINFTGETESASRYLKIHNVTAQGRKLDVLNNIYTPSINPEWWESLSQDEKNYYLDVIHINNNAHFGWYGKIEYEYFSAADKGSAYRNHNAAIDNTITHMHKKWIYDNKSTIAFDWDKDES